MAALITVLLFALAGNAADDHADAARKAKDASNWAELESVATAWSLADAENPPALAYLALAQAQLKKFDACAASLQKIETLGRSVDSSLRGYGGVPMTDVVNALYSHCWANWSPEFNRECWSPVFDAFPESPSALVPAARLLMSALALEDPAGIERFEAYFDARIEREDQAKRNLGTPKTRYYYAQAYVRAGVGGEKTMRLASESYEAAWASAVRQHRYEGETDEGHDLAKLEQVHLSTDDEYNVLALAAVLSRAYEADTNPLAAEEAAPSVTFDDVTDEVGLGGVRAGRVAVGDFDEDGDPDLCFSGRLFRNDKGKRFVEVDAKAGGIAQRGSSALFGDYDNDGDLDVLLPAGPHPRLWRNTGKRGRYAFEDVTKEAGLDAIKITAPPEGAAWVDVDGDGWLDMYLAAYEAPMSTGHQDHLVRNNGDGTFSSATEASQVGEVAVQCGRGVATADFDGDGDRDLYVSNYRLNPNFLFENDGQGVFTETSEARGIRGVRQPSDGRYFGHTIGSCFGDVDNDGDLDLFAANLAHPRFVFQGFSNLSMLYINSGPEGGYRFTDERRERGIRFQETHSDPALVDFDNDGDLDLSLTCIYEGVPTALYENDGSGRFTPITFRSRAVAFNGWGQAWLDFDGDGDLDWLVASNSGCRLFRNGGNDNHWLALRLDAKRANRYGIGARVTVKTLEGDASRTFVRELTSARGTTSQDGEILHFGLGDYAGKVRLTVRWPDTLQEESQTVRTDRQFKVKQVRTVRAKRTKD